MGMISIKKIVGALIVLFVIIVNLNKSYGIYEKEILFISSYSPEFISFKDQVKGIKYTLGDEFNLQVQYMNAKSFSNKVDESDFYNLLKYSNFLIQGIQIHLHLQLFLHHLQLVLAYHNQFLLHHRSGGQHHAGLRHFPRRRRCAFRFEMRPDLHVGLCGAGGPAVRVCAGAAGDVGLFYPLPGRICEAPGEFLVLQKAPLAQEYHPRADGLREIKAALRDGEPLLRCRKFTALRDPADCA